MERARSIPERFWSCIYGKQRQRYEIFIERGSLRGQYAFLQPTTGANRPQPRHGWSWGQKVLLSRCSRLQEIALFTTNLPLQSGVAQNGGQAKLPGSGWVAERMANFGRVKRREILGITIEEKWYIVVFIGQYALLRAKSRNLLLGLLVGGLHTLSYPLRLPDKVEFSWQ